MEKEIRIVGSSKKDLTSDAKDFYEKYWTEGAQVPDGTRLQNQRLLDRLFTEPIRGRQVLELGVGGQGGMVYELKDHNAVFGLDASAAAKKNCEAFGINVQVVNLDKDGIPFDDQCFDLVFAFEVFEHFGNPQYVLEEVRRVLKPAGSFILSTPNPFIHHWPRLFYPSLFQEKAFREFIMANRFKIIKKHNVNLNPYAPRLNNEDTRAWMWVWHCERMVEDESEPLFQYGKYFWEQENEMGINIFPIEAIDLFRASYKLDKNNIDALGYLTRSLVYRLINGEREEFEYYYKRLKYYANNTQYPNNITAMYHTALLFLEVKVFGGNTMEETEFIEMVRKLSTFPESRRLVDKIKQKIDRIRIISRANQAS